MNRPLIVSISAGFVALLSLAIVSEAQRRHDHSLANDGVPVESHRDYRMALAIGSAAEAGLKLTLREHLEALPDVIAALGRKEFEKAATVAHDESLWGSSKETGKRVIIDNSWFYEVHYVVYENGAWRIRGHAGEDTEALPFGVSPHPFF